MLKRARVLHPTAHGLYDELTAESCDLLSVLEMMHEVLDSHTGGEVSNINFHQVAPGIAVVTDWMRERVELVMEKAEGMLDTIETSPTLSAPKGGAS